MAESTTAQSLEVTNTDITANEVGKGRKGGRKAEAFPTFTQTDIAAILQVTPRTVRNYLSRLREVFVWLDDSEWTDAKGRYPQWVIDELRQYQDACGLMRVDAASNELVDNADRIGFDQYRDHVWKREQYNPCETVDAEFVNDDEPSLRTIDNSSRRNYDDLNRPTDLAYDPKRNQLANLEQREIAQTNVEDFSDSLRQLRGQIRTAGKTVGGDLAADFKEALSGEFQGEVIPFLQQLLSGVQLTKPTN